MEVAESAAGLLIYKELDYWSTHTSEIYGLNRVL
jgi:hypothetical protein